MDLPSGNQRSQCQNPPNNIDEFSPAVNLSEVRELSGPATFDLKNSLTNLDVPPSNGFVDPDNPKYISLYHCSTTICGG